MRTEIVIDASRQKVWSVFDDVDKRSRWQPALKSYTHKSGVAGQVGSVAELTYSEDGRNFVMQEHISEKREPDFLAGSYETQWASTTVVNHFESIDGETTRWVGYANFRFKGFMKIMALFLGGSIRKRTEADMQRFKLLVESEVAGS